MSEAAAAGEARSWLAPVAATLLLQAMTGLMFLAVPVIAPELARSGFAPGHVGIYASLVFAGAMPAALASGALVSRFGPLRVAQGAIALAAVALLGMQVGSTFAFLVLGVVVGAGYGPVTPATAVILRQVAPARHAHLLFSVNQAGIALGGLVAGAVLPVVVLAASWRWALLLCAGLALISALAVQPLRARLDATRDSNTVLGFASLWPALGAVVAVRPARKLAVAAFCFGAIQVSVFAYAVTYLVQDLGFDLVGAGALFGVMQAAAIGGRLLWGWVADHSGSPRVVLALLGAGCFVAMLAVVSMTPHWPAWAGWLTWAGVGLTVGAWNGVLFAEAAHADGPGASSHAAGIAFFTFAGVLMGPLLFSGVLLVFATPSAAFVAVGVAALLAGINLLGSGRGAPEGAGS